MKQNSNAWGDLERAISRAHDAASQALVEKAHGQLLEIANWLKQTENLKNRRNQLDVDATRLADNVEQLLSQKTVKAAEVHAAQVRDGLINGNLHSLAKGKKNDAKARGRAWRFEYVKSKEEMGEHLHRITETLYRTTDDMVRGIAYGSESPKRPDKWFLGLPHDQFQEAVLICESLNSSAIQIHLPKSFIDEHQRHFSAAHGQTLFNVIRSGAKYSISIPDVRPIDLSPYTEHGPSKPGNEQ